MKLESNRQKTMKDTDGGLHPAVDGQNLGEGEGKAVRRQISYKFSFDACMPSTNESKGEKLVNISKY